MSLVFDRSNFVSLFMKLQVQFMPDALKPPMNTLAGFLKGGRLFGEGAIET